MQNQVLILDCQEYGQPTSVLKSLEGCLKAEGIAYSVTEPIEKALDTLSRFGTILLSSAPRLNLGHIEIIKNYVKRGGRLIASGPIGADDGIASDIEELFGVNVLGTTKEILVPFLTTDLEPFQKEDALLFLHDIGCKQIVEPTNGEVIARSLEWNTETQRYDASERITIMSSHFGKGRAVYINLDLANEKKIPPLISGQWITGDPHSPDATIRMGHPMVKNTQPELAIFLLSLIRLINDSPLAWVGHWPGGWKTVVSLTGDVHEEELYGPQVYTTESIAECMKKAGLDGLFTFTITAKAVEESPELLNNLMERGYHIVPHSAYTSTWMYNFSEQEQKREIDKCLEVYKKLLTDGDKLLGWRGHGWSSNDDTEMLLDKKGCVWISDLHSQRYGDFGENDFHLPKGQAVTMMCLPEQCQGRSILRLPQTCYSIEYLAEILASCYGVPCDLNPDPTRWTHGLAVRSACKLVEEKFYDDIRFEALHLADWHPEEEFVRIPEFAETFEHMCEVWKKAEHVGIMRATEVAHWWLCRKNILVHEITSEGDNIILDCDFGPKPKAENPTIRLNIGDISKVVLENATEWRYFDKGWIALPTNITGRRQITITKGPPIQPTLVDTTSVVSQACRENNKLRVVVSEMRRKQGRIKLYLPKLSDINKDGKLLEKDVRGYHILTYGKGRHTFVISTSS